MVEPLASVSERLYRDYPAVPLTEIIKLVRQCRADIDTGAREDCILELVERLARARLVDRGTSEPDSSSGIHPNGPDLGLGRPKHLHD
jgi:hypothetical protein